MCFRGFRSAFGDRFGREFWVIKECIEPALWEQGYKLVGRYEYATEVTMVAVVGGSFVVLVCYVVQAECDCGS